MSAEIKALGATFPGSIPSDDFSFLIEVLTGKGTFDRLKAVKAAYDVAGYLLGRFFGEASTQSAAKAKKVSKKAIAEALTAVNPHNKSAVTLKAFPAWLIPVLLNLAQQWLANQKK